MIYLMQHGLYLNVSYLAKVGSEEEQNITNYLLTQFYGYYARAHHGETCLLNTANGEQFISDLSARETGGYGKKILRH